MLEKSVRAEDPALALDVIGAIALHLQIFDYRRTLEASPAALAGAHEKFELLSQIRNLVSGGLKFQETSSNSPFFLRRGAFSRSGELAIS